MAREIKITQRGQELDVRGITDTLGRNESVVAARWQDGGEVKWFANTARAFQELRTQTDGVIPEDRVPESRFWEYLAENF